MVEVGKTTEEMTTPNNRSFDNGREENELSARLQRIARPFFRLLERGGIDRLISALSPITAREICQRWNERDKSLTLTDVDIRTLVRHWRMQGAAIGNGFNGNPGYFIARNKSEMEETITDLRHRELAARTLLSTMEAVYDTLPKMKTI